jgi:hypothetical protein
MALEEGTGAEAGLLGHKTMQGSHRFDGFEHWKYPETVGNDTYTDDVNFNSHESSEYSIQRMANTSTMTNEPFMMFEFMKIDEKASAAAQPAMPGLSGASANSVKNITANQQIGMMQSESWYYDQQAKSIDTSGRSGNAYVNTVDSVMDSISGFFKDLVNTAKRNYVGSVALYMPTDIQINDQMIYNEDTRRLGGIAESISNNKGGFKDVANWTVLSSPEVLAGVSVLGSALKIPFAGMISTLASYGIGTILQTELQRSTGKIANPNELLRYQQTALRSFTFTWTILPDSENESKHATGLIKTFRKAAHATRDNAVLVTVPDHVIVSFHGARDMIQLPPCYIESVNVTYNPNTSSFFKQNNSPVEIGLGVTLKEIIPIYSSDIDKGY